MGGRRDGEALMYPAAFRYHAPATLEAALGLLAELGDRARPLAGGHSLIPMMKLRLAQPEHVIDLRKIAGLAFVRETDRGLAIGAATTHWQVESSPLVAARLKLLAEVAAGIADPLVRNRGTIGGSLAHADPAADYPASLLALEAELVCASAKGRRVIKADAWFQGLMTTALAADELLVEVHVTAPPPGTGAAYIKLPHPATRFAIVGVAALVTRDGSGRCTRARLGITGVGPTATRLTGVEAALAGAVLDQATIEVAASRAAEGLDLQDDRHATAAEKAALAGVFTRRALEAAVARCSR
jgi:aerobic carbon-monoxide dehydrogenase medium subunit